MGKKWRFFLLRLFLIAFLCGAGAYFLLRIGVLDEIAGLSPVGEISILDRAAEFFGVEPSEVRTLRTAVVESDDPGHLEYYFDQLNAGEQRCYRQMLAGIRENKEQFYITLSSDQEVNRVYKALLFDHPELYWIHNRERVYRTVYQDRDYCLFSPGYTYTEAERVQIDQAMEQAFQEVCMLLTDSMDDYEKVKAVYSYLIDHASYGPSEDDQSIAGVFWKQEAVCAGYAGAFMYLLERLSIPCIYVEGEAIDNGEGHAWNIVTLDGQPYYVDVTNGDQPDFLQGDAALLEEHKTILYDYLCPFPDEYETLYKPADSFSIPDCTAGDKNFYVMNGSCLSTGSDQEIYDLSCMRIDNNAAVVRFKLADEAAYEAARTDWVDGEAPQAVAQYYMRVHGMNRVEYHCGVLDSFYTIYYIF